MFFLEPVIAARNPPAITHPEFFYGFLGLAIAFQFLFALIAWQPRRLLAAMPAAVAEKCLYATMIGLLVVWHRLGNAGAAAFAAVDAVLGGLFLLSYLSLKQGASKDPKPLERDKAVFTAAMLPRYLVVTQRTPDFRPEVVAPHYAFLASLRDKGVLLDAGGFVDKTGGAYVVSASSQAQAEAIASLDPLHTWGASKLVVREWKSTYVDISRERA